MAKSINENPRVLLDAILQLIARDIKHIQEIKGQLPSETAATLCKYSGAVLNVVEDMDENDNKERKKYSSLTTEELKKMVQELGVESE